MRFQTWSEAWNAGSREISGHENATQAWNVASRPKSSAPVRVASARDMTVQYLRFASAAASPAASAATASSGRSASLRNRAVWIMEIVVAKTLWPCFMKRARKRPSLMTRTLSAKCTGVNARNSKVASAPGPRSTRSRAKCVVQYSTMTDAHEISRWSVSVFDRSSRAKRSSSDS